MKININLMIAAAGMVFITGCVSTKKFNELQASYNQLQTTNSSLVREGESCKSNLERANGTISSLEDRLRAEQEHQRSLQSALDKCLTSAGQGNVNVSKLVA